MPDPWELFKPTDPEELIKQSATKYGVDPKLVRAVAKTESNFNPKAVSPKGAQGVMQLMPATSKRLGVKDPLDAAQNIDAGTRELGRLELKYKGDRTKTAAAYNAGEGAVDKAGGVPEFPETQDYVQKVNNEYAGDEPWTLFGSPSTTAPANKFGDPDVLRSQHEANQAAERLQGIVGPLNTAAQFVRGATPAVATALGLTSAGGLSPIAYGTGELVSRQLEKLAGTRESINPLGVAEQAALGFIPLPDMALKIAAATKNPKAWYPFLKAPEEALHGMGFTAASHGFDVLSGEEGATPEMSLGEMARAGLAGGSVAALGSLYRIRHITQKANDLNYKQGGDRVYAGIDLPKKGQPAEQAAKSFDNWLPIIQDYAQGTKAKIDNIKDLRNTSESMERDHYQQAYLPLVEPMLKNQVSTQAIYDSVKAKLESNSKLMTETPEVAAKILKKFEAYQNGSISMQELLDLRDSYNKATKGMQKRLALTPGFKANVKGESDLTAASAIRDLADSAVNKFYNNDIDVKEILRAQRDIYNMTEHVREADQTNDAINRSERGQRLGLLSRLARPVARSSERGALHSVGGGILTGITEYANTPDAQVRTGFKLLGRTPSRYTMQTPQNVPPIRKQIGAAPEEGIPRSPEELRAAAFRNVPSEGQAALPPWEGGPTIEGPTPETFTSGPSPETGPPPETKTGRRGAARKIDLPEQAQHAPESKQPRAVPFRPSGSRLGDMPEAPPSLREALKRLEDLIYPK